MFASIAPREFFARHESTGCTSCAARPLHAPNPILVEFREKMRGRVPIGYNAPANMLELIRIGSFAGATDAELKHARRVFTLMAARGLSEVSR